MEKVILAIDGENFMGQACHMKKEPDLLALKNFIKAQKANALFVKSVVYLPIPPNGNGKRRRIKQLHKYLKRKGFRVVVKEGEAKAQGSFKANVDTILVADLMSMAFKMKPETVILVSGDSDFSCLSNYLIEMNIGMEVASIKSHLSSRLEGAAKSLINLEPFFHACASPHEHTVPRSIPEIEYKYHPSTGSGYWVYTRQAA